MRMIGYVFGGALAAALALAAHADPAAPAAAPPAARPAQSPPPAAPLTVTRPDTDIMARRMARRAARLDESLSSVRAGLKLTSAQDALWPPVADAVHALDTARGFRFRQTLASADSQIDGLALQADHMAKMGAALGKLAGATKPFVASLTPEQKSRLPALLQDIRPRKLIDRAFDVPPDGGPMDAGRVSGPGAGQRPQGDRSWGIGRGDSPGASGPGADGGRTGGPRSGAGGVDDPQDRNDDE